MARIFRKKKIVQAIPKRGQPVVVSARYEVNQDVVKALGVSRLKSIAFEVEPLMRSAISKSVAEEYKKSGLSLTGSGQLFRNATENFEVDINTSSGGRLGNILVEARWLDPTIPYFFVHLFGHPGIQIPEIVPVHKKALFWPGARHPVKKVRAHKVKIPRRNFIRLSGVASNTMARALQDAIRRHLMQVQGMLRAREAKRDPSTRRRAEIAEASQKELDRRMAARLRRRTAERQALEAARAGRERVTAHRVRRALRSRGLSAQEARLAAADIERLGLREQSLEDVVRLLTEGRFIQVVEVPGMRMTGGPPRRG